MSKVPALLKWIGNKQRFAETIIDYMPTSFNDYYEPFLGSGAVLAHLLYTTSNSLIPTFKNAYGSDILPFLIDIFNPRLTFRLFFQFGFSLILFVLTIILFLLSFGNSITLSVSNFLPITGSRFLSFASFVKSVLN